MQLKKIASKIPYVGKALWGIEGIRWYRREVDRIQVDYFKRVMSQGCGVIEVTVNVKGDPRATGSYTVFYPWDGSTIYGEYPYYHECGEPYTEPYQPQRRR